MSDIALRIDNGRIEVLNDAKLTDLSWLQQKVGGYIELVQRVGDIIVLGNEEGRLIGMKPNVVRSDGEILVGPLLVLGMGIEDHRGLRPGEVMRVSVVQRDHETLPRLVILN